MVKSSKSSKQLRRNKKKTIRKRGGGQTFGRPRPPPPPDSPTLTNLTIREAVSLWMRNKDEAIRIYGHISNWDVSNVTDMSNLFRGTNFNKPIGNWNVSNVTSMNEMFRDTEAFNQPIGNWNVSNVTDMNGLFYYATAFNQPIGNWNVSNVTSMAYMFEGAIAFNQPIGNWNVSKVTDMNSMFRDANAFNQPIGNWNVSNVTYMEMMFDGATAFNQDISEWDVLNAMENEVNVSIAYEVHDSSAKINMKELINVLSSLVDDKFNHQINMKTFIRTKLESFISKININEALTTQFQQVQERLNGVEYSDLSPDTLEPIFYALLYVDKQSDEFIEAYTSTLIEDCATAYKGVGDTMSCSAGILERMVTSLVQACTFEKSTDKENETCDTIINIIDNNPNKMIPIAIQDWYKLHSTPEGQFPDGMSVDDKKRNLKDFLLRKFPDNEALIDKQIADIADHIGYETDDFEFSGGKRRRNTKKRKTKKTNKKKTIRKRGGGQTFGRPRPPPPPDSPTLTNLTIREAVSLWMRNKDEAIRIYGHISNWDVSNVTDMSNLFRGTNFNKPIGNWNVSNVTSMNEMFRDTEAFNQPIGNWNVSNVTDMNGLFYYATAFNQPIGNWNVSNVTSMAYMFEGAIAFNQPIGNWNVSKVTDMNSMFRDANAFNQPIGNWNVSNVTYMEMMFDGATAFNQDISEWDVLNAMENEVNVSIAYEVHDSSAKINMKELINVLSSLVDDKFNHQINMKTFIRTKLESFISKININEALTTQFQQVQERLNGVEYSDLSPDTLEPIFYALLYVDKQSDEFIEAYTSTLIEDCATAYKGVGDTMSCSAGILERMVTSLVQACTFEKSTDKENETCDTIINIIDNNPNKMIPIAIQDWYKLHSTPEGQFPDGMSVDDKKRNLKDFLLRKFPDNEALIDEKIAGIADYIGYEPDDFA